MLQIKLIRKYHLYREIRHFLEKVLSTKICAKFLNCEQLTIWLLNNFENDVMFIENNIIFELLWMRNFHQELKM